MSNDAQHDYHGVELLRAASAAAEQAPQLAAEIRLRSEGIAKRVSAGQDISAADVDVRNLIGLLEQSGVQVPAAHRRETAAP